jgi:hypothetical protein
LTVPPLSSLGGFSVDWLAFRAKWIQFKARAVKSGA